MKHRVVMGIRSRFGEQVAFNTDDGECMYMRARDWEDMGRPTMITVSIKPGDCLTPKADVRVPSHTRSPMEGPGF